MSLLNKTALITNASSRLSQAVANRLGLSSAKIFLTDPNEEQLKSAVAHFQDIGVEVAGAIANLNCGNQRKRLFNEVEKAFGHLDIFANCPGDNQIRKNIIDNTPEEFDEIYSQFLTTPFKLCKEAVPLLKKSKNGSIIFLTSIAGYTSFYDIGLYSSAQTAALTLVKTLAKDLGKEGVRVNSVVTGMLEDDNSNGLWAQNDRCANQQLAPMIPMQRIGKSHDCAGLVEFLASDQATYITGENLVVSGGINVRL